MSTDNRKVGRPKGTVGTGKFGEKTIPMRIPLRLVEKVKQLLEKELKKCKK